MVDFLGERDSNKTLLNRSLQMLADSVGVRVADFGLVVIEAFNGQVQLIIAEVKGTEILSFPVQQHANSSKLSRCQIPRNPLVILLATRRPPHS